MSAETDAAEEASASTSGAVRKTVGRSCHQCKTVKQLMGVTEDLLEEKRQRYKEEAAYSQRISIDFELLQNKVRDYWYIQDYLEESRWTSTSPTSLSCRNTAGNCERIKAGVDSDSLTRTTQITLSFMITMTEWRGCALRSIHRGQYV